MSNGKQKVFHLEIEGEHYYFGSPKALFDTMGEERLHMKYTSFHSNISLKEGDVYVNRRHGWILRVGRIVQAKTNRGNNWADIIQHGVATALAAQQQEVTGTAEEVKQPESMATTPTPEAPNTVPTLHTEGQEVSPTPADEGPTTGEIVHKRSKKKGAGDVPEQLLLF